VPNADPGLVVGAFRRRFEVETPDGTTIVCAVKGRSLTPACGDVVEFARDADREGVITSVKPRVTELARQDAHRQKTVAANVTDVLGVVAVAPPFNPELIDRWTIASEAAGCSFRLILNKMDLPEADAVLARLQPYARLGYALIPLNAKKDIDALRPALNGARSVLVGQSGMGKSTIINAATGQARAKTAEISESLNAGRHTTTHTRLHRLGPDAWIVDSPGMKEFGVNQLTPSGLEQAFVEFRPLLGQCRFRNCVHDQEPGCAIREGVEAGTIMASRVATYHRLRGDILG
jgi:ribosome biogenesis GTPase